MGGNMTHPFVTHRQNSARYLGKIIFGVTAAAVERCSRATRRRPLTWGSALRRRLHGHLIGPDFMSVPNFGGVFDFEDVTTPIGAPSRPIHAASWAAPNSGITITFATGLSGSKANLMDVGRRVDQFRRTSGLHWVTVDQVWYGTLSGRLGYIAGAALGLWQGRRCLDECRLQIFPQQRDSTAQIRLIRPAADGMPERGSNI